MTAARAMKRLPRSLDDVLAQLEGVELDEATISAVVASLGSGPAR